MIESMPGHLPLLCLLALLIMALVAGAAQGAAERQQESTRSAPEPERTMAAAGRLGPARDELPHRLENCTGCWQLNAADAIAWCDGCGARVSYEHDGRVLDLALGDVRLRRILHDIETASGEVTIVRGPSRHDVPRWRAA